MRFWRLLIGFSVVIAAAWVLVGEQLAGVSADAVVNSRVVTVRSVIAGEVTLPFRNLGSSVSKGEVLGSVTDQLADTVRLNDLLLERDLAAAGADRLEAGVRATKEAIAIAQLRSSTFQRGQIALLEAMLKKKANVLDDRLASNVDGKAKLNAFRLYPEVDLDLAQPLDLQISYAQRGVFLGNGYNDAPWSEQFADQLTEKLAQTDSELSEAGSRVAALDKRLNLERERVAALTSQEVTSLVNGIVWEYRAADGQTVQRGDPLLDLVDCDTVLVTASVTENVFNHLALGDPVTFRFSGRSEKYPGTVARLAGAGAETLYRAMAVAPSAQHLERYDVAVIVPDLTKVSGGCNIGRTGRLFFTPRPLDFFR